MKTILLFIALTLMACDNSSAPQNNGETNELKHTGIVYRGTIYWDYNPDLADFELSFSSVAQGRVEGVFLSGPTKDTSVFFKKFPNARFEGKLDTLIGSLRLVYGVFTEGDAAGYEGFGFALTPAGALSLVEDLDYPALLVPVRLKLK